MSDRAARAWVEEKLNELDLEGRDGLYTHLIGQEASFWYKTILDGKLVAEDEVDFLVRRRGFNADETRKFRALAAFFNDNAETIRLLWLPEDN